LFCTALSGEAASVHTESVKYVLTAIVRTTWAEDVLVRYSAWVQQQYFWLLLLLLLLLKQCNMA
jgi:hypothetical protein